MAALWAVKLSPAALAFPFVLILLVPVRLFLFKYLFSDQELEQVSHSARWGENRVSLRGTCEFCTENCLCSCESFGFT